MSRHLPPYRSGSALFLATRRNGKTIAQSVPALFYDTSRDAPFTAVARHLAVSPSLTRVTVVSRRTSGTGSCEITGKTIFATK